jgi:hypothetical protein
VRREILLGILYCDLIGFHTYDYARHFLSSCTRILGLPTMPNGVEFEGRLAHIGTFPIGIEPASFIDVNIHYHVVYLLLQLTCLVNTEFEEGLGQDPNFTTGAAFWRSQSHCRC